VVIVLGIDPGTARTGFGVVRSQGGTLRALDHGVVTTPAGMDLGARLAQIFEAIRELVGRHRPDAVALETLFVGSNPRTILTVGHARGAALAACGVAGVPSAEYSPGEVKTAVCGYGRAEKQQVARMVEAILGQGEAAPRSDHASDALAVAICHLASSRTQALTGARR
jgi:crossover junction endodeoxyribonuclease RuvC